MVAASQSTDERISALTAHTWTPQPAPAKWVQSVLDDAVRRSVFLATLRRRMFDETGTRLLDWIDYVALPADDEALDELSEVGYQPDSAVPKIRAWKHSQGLFPRFLKYRSKQWYPELEKPLLHSPQLMLPLSLDNRRPEQVLLQQYR